MMPKLALLAGGLATRLRPVTEKIPKALLPVAGKPFISHQLALLRTQGVREVVVCAGYLGSQIQEFTGDGSSWGLELEFSLDGDKLLGTGGALKKARQMLGDPFWVLYGDSYLELDLQAILQAWRASGLPALMTVFHNQGQYDKSNVFFRDGRILRYRKDADPEMKHIDHGLGLLSQSCLDLVDREVFDLAEVYGLLARAGRLQGFEAARRFYEIGSPQGISDTEAHLLEARGG
jgi:NDP-sugar pyrophosphorylase family protein